MKTALISVYNKDNIEKLAHFLMDFGWNIISTGGTAEFLRKNQITVTDVSEITRFPDCLDGRVKTLHPAVHAGILARRTKKAHIDALNALNIGTIDLVCVNLYPFFEKSQLDISDDKLTEFIDIGGPAMLRAAAKNWRDVIVLCDTADYQSVIDSLSSGTIDQEFLRKLAGKAFNLTAAYDGAISDFLLKDEFPEYWTPSLKKKQELRYGENSHQKATLYTSTGNTGIFSSIEILGGKELSYNNIRDLDLAWKCVCAFGLPENKIPPLGANDVKRLLPDITDGPVPVCTAVKHNTPCGTARGVTAVHAFKRAYKCDPLSIFGGIVAFNVPVTTDTAQAMAELFLEIVVAPDYEKDALAILRKKKNLRIIQIKRPPEEPLETVSIDGGLLVQHTNRRLIENWNVVTCKSIETALIPDIIFGLRTVNFVKSNGIVIIENGMTTGIGGGETSRISAAELALNRAAGYTGTKILVSDAFFPFPDIVEAAAHRGISAIAQSGGADGDSKSIEACNKYGIPMVFTGVRYFKH
ncbi:MAG: bifunctional phosphoribosylaminoimidazolecarboxamide formyltransferase/IMP cyclohydrolase [Spirochaetaceae bacterium]|jgi:phosphoribosylaminoimidazolecarboxamide formyltransferase/IMP cyclohydrolase|nr:bifunctional phosphoribosylaminoimidazolecarboxamide formyltransferase/IMP cyclohydrolase [Spirochaetaceae bacterium]